MTKVYDDTIIWLSKEQNSITRTFNNKLGYLTFWFQEPITTLSQSNDGIIVYDEFLYHHLTKVYDDTIIWLLEEQKSITGTFNRKLGYLIF